MLSIVQNKALKVLNVYLRTNRGDTLNTKKQRLFCTQTSSITHGMVAEDT